MAFGTITTNNVAAHPQTEAAPSGITDGDILVGLMTSDSGTDTPAFPAGYTQPTGSPIKLTLFDANTFAVALKIAASESGSYSFGNTTNIIGGLIRMTARAQTTTPHRVSATKSDSGVLNHSLNSAAFSSVTDTLSDILVIAINDGAGADETFTQPAGYTKDADISDGSPFARQFMIAHKDAVPAGFDGILTVSSTGTVALAIYVIALADGGVQNQVAWVTA